MGFDRRSATLVVPATPATVTQTMNLRSAYIRPLSFKILLTGTDTAVKLRLTDADSRVFYLDAADKDYKTAAVYTPMAADDVTTGLSMAPYDSVGVIGAAAQIPTGGNAIVKNPIEVAIVNGGTGGDSIAFTLDYEYGVFGAKTFSLPVTVAGSSTKTISLESKFAQILGFKALSVGTSTTTRIQIKDADGKIVYLDAADKDYDTAALDKLLCLDPTVTGLTQVVPRDTTGAAAQAGIEVWPAPLAKSPITIDYTLAEGGDEILTMTLYYKTA